MNVSQPMAKGQLTKEMKRYKERDINNLSTTDIVWHITCRHKVILLVNALLFTNMVWVLATLRGWGWI